MQPTYKNLEKYILPEDVNIQIGVSGGRSSAYSLAHIIMANCGLPDNCVLTMQNTGFEMEHTFVFLRNVEEYFGVKIAYLERDLSLPEKVRVVGHNSLNMDGGPMIDLFTEIVPRRKDGTAGVRPLPNPVQRTCTSNLKIKTADRYLTKVLGWERPYYAVMGYRADEAGRVKRRKKQDEKRPREEGGIGLFPMFEAGADGSDVMNFWRAMPFDLEMGSEFSNCDFCFMKSTWKIKMMMAMYPERVAPWLAFEARVSDRPGPFRKDRPPLAQLWAEVQAGDMGAPENDKQCGECGV